MAQTVEHLHSKCKAINLNPNTACPTGKDDIISGLQNLDTYQFTCNFTIFFKNIFLNPEQLYLLLLQTHLGC
jgi:hypothetical protein